MEAVPVQVQDGIAVLTVRNPPVNALGIAVRQGLMDGVRAVLADASVRGAIIIGDGRTFPAGADIREFGKPRPPPGLTEVIAVIETSGKPFVAAIHGTALGGGLELAMACHWRVASPDARVGLPEVKLGILPGAGGTQRLPRLVGVRAALDWMTTGRHVGAQAAHDAGVIDAIIDGALLAGAVAFLRAALDEGRRAIAVRDRTDRIAGADAALFDEYRQTLRRRQPGYEAPLRIVDCVQTGVARGVEAGQAAERENFARMVAGPEHRALKHLFFAEREAAKLPEPAEPKPVRTAAVIGAGTMGGGIAMCFANAGIPVTLVETTQEALDRGLKTIDANYARSVSRGSTPQAAADAARALIAPSTRMEDAAQADIVIEAVFENMALKQEVFARLDAVMKPGAVLATNTSTLDIDAIAGATARPGDVIGTHFFSPANVMRLLENVRGRASSAGTIATVMTLGKRLGKIPVLAGNCDGFIGNRMLAVYSREADFLLEEGATPWQVDSVLKGFGLPMGLYLMRDMAGLDVSWRIRQHREATRPKHLRYSVVADRICEMGRFGQKTGAGYYRYEGRDATPDPAIEQLIEAVARERGIARRAIGDEEILHRVLYAMVNEGAKIVEEGIARSAGDIDVVYVHGYGFPSWRGGPMCWAEQHGLPRIAETVERYHREHGAFWTPAPLLLQRARDGQGWDGRAPDAAAGAPT